MKFIICIPVVILTLLLPATAADASPLDATNQTYLQEAIAYWNLPPTCTPLVAEQVPLETLFTPGGVMAMGIFEPEPCRIRVEEGDAPCNSKETMFHEVGHWDGLSHSSDPLSIMSPEPLGRGPFCRQIEEEAHAEFEEAEAQEEIRLRREARTTRRRERRRLHHHQTIRA